jgi:hypothetical protein
MRKVDADDACLVALRTEPARAHRNEQSARPSVKHRPSGQSWRSKDAVPSHAPAPPRSTRKPVEARTRQARHTLPRRIDGRGRARTRHISPRRIDAPRIKPRRYSRPLRDLTREIPGIGRARPARTPSIVRQGYESDSPPSTAKLRIAPQGRLKPMPDAALSRARAGQACRLPGPHALADALQRRSKSSPHGPVKHFAIDLLGDLHDSLTLGSMPLTRKPWRAIAHSVRLTWAITGLAPRER